MSLETIYYITQILAVLLVIGSLLFVGIQIRDNSRAITDQNRWQRVNAIIDAQIAHIENPHVLEAFNKTAPQAWKDFVTDLCKVWGVSYEEAHLVAWTQGVYLWTHWGQYRSMKTKTDEAELRNIILTWYTVEPMKSNFAHPVSQALYEPSFNAWVEDILSSVPSEHASEMGIASEKPDA